MKVKKLTILSIKTNKTKNLKYKILGTLSSVCIVQGILALASSV